MIQMFLVQTLLVTIFDEIYFVLCKFKSVRQSDRNASDFLITIIIGVRKTQQKTRYYHLP